MIQCDPWDIYIRDSMVCSTQKCAIESPSEKAVDEIPAPARCDENSGSMSKA